MRKCKIRGLSLLMTLVLAGSTVFTDSGMRTVKAEDKEVVAAVSPWAYYDGIMDNSKTYTERGYQYASEVTGSNATYQGALLSDVDLSMYKEIRFAVKSDGSAYYEIGGAIENSWNLSAGNGNKWIEIKLTVENNAFRLYSPGWTEYTYPLDMNLSELQMRFGTTGTFLMTEVRGILRDDATDTLKVVADNFSTHTGTFDSAERPVHQATGSTLADTAWTAAEYSLTSVQLETYEKLLFYIRKTTDDTAAWFESAGYFGITALKTKWVELKMTRNDDGTWKLYFGGKVSQESVALSELSQITAKFGTASYAFSEVFGVKRAGLTYETGDVNEDLSVDIRDLCFEKKAVKAYEEHGTCPAGCDIVRDNALNDRDMGKLRNILLTGEVVAASKSWANAKGSSDDNALSEVKGMGYEHTTKTGNGDETYTLESNLMADLDVSIYSEIRFAVKSDGAAYWQFRESDAETDIAAGNSTEWVEIKFVDEGNDRDYLQCYVNGAWNKAQLKKNGNLSDYKMMYNMGGTLLMTEVRGTLRKDVTGKTQVIRDCMRDGSGTVSYTELPIYGADKATLFENLGWNHSTTLPDISLSSYGMVKFYVKNMTGNTQYLGVTNDKNNWESKEKAYGQSWAEVRFQLNENSKWDVYIGGEKILSSLDITNTNQIYISYGNNVTCYISEVFAADRSFFVTSREILSSDGSMQYALQYDSTYDFAAEEFIKYMKESTGADFSASEATKKIVIGTQYAVDNQMDFSKLTTDHGYVIQESGNDLYVYGRTVQGTLNGVYELLNRAIGLEIYTDDCYTFSYQTGTAIQVDVKDSDSVFNPKIDYNFDLNGETRNHASYRKRLGYVLDYEVLGGSAHAETSFVKDTSYFTGTLTNGHMPLDEKTAKEAAKWLYETGVRNNKREEYLFGLSDDRAWNDSTEAGQARTDQYVTFMNLLVKELSTIMKNSEPDRTISVILVAYANTVKAPSVTMEPQDNVRMSVMYAPSSANWYKSMKDEVNQSVPVGDDAGKTVFTYHVTEEFTKWKNAVKETGDIYLWTYHTYFDNYLSPFDCFDSLYENYKLAAEMGVKGVYDNVQYNNAVASDWNRLKVYLRSELVKYPDMTKDEYNERIDKFIKAYFGPSADLMKTAFTSERTILNGVYENNKANANVFRQNYGCGQAAVMFSTQGNYEKWGLTRTQKYLVVGDYSYGGTFKTEVLASMNSALNMIGLKVSVGEISKEQGEVYTSRIQLEMLSIRYILLAVPSKGKADSSNSDTFAVLAEDCNQAGLTKYKEVAPQDNTLITETDLKTLAGWN